MSLYWLTMVVVAARRSETYVMVPSKPAERVDLTFLDTSALKRIIGRAVVSANIAAMTTHMTAKHNATETVQQAGGVLVVMSRFFRPLLPGGALPSVPPTVGTVCSVGVRWVIDESIVLRVAIEVLLTRVLEGLDGNTLMTLPSCVVSLRL